MRILLAISVFNDSVISPLSIPGSALCSTSSYFYRKRFYRLFLISIMKRLLGLLLFCTSAALAQQDILLSNYSYPFPVSYLDLNTQHQKLQMAYMDIKPQNPNGKVVVLMHGKNFGGAYWKTTIEALTNDGFRVIAPDQIGFGKSSKPP